MKWLALTLLFSFSSFAQLRVVAPSELEIEGFSKREGELYSTDDFQTLLMHTSAGPVTLNKPIDPVEIQVAFIKDVKTSGTAGGTFTSGSWQTRELNTLDDPSGLVASLTANQFTLPAGSYLVEASAPSVGVEANKAKIRNVTDSTDSIIGETAYGRALYLVYTVSRAMGIIEIASPKTFELQHRCSYTRADYGYGASDSLGAPEVYSQIKITRLKY